jgi:hypothetical protein
MATTFTQFVNALEAVVVTGVNRRYGNGPPQSLNSSDLPAQWVQLPRGGDTTITFGSLGGWPTLAADFVIAVEAVGQNVTDVNFPLTVSMMDNVMSAFTSAETCGLFTKSVPTYEIRQTVVQVAGIDYWAVIATVTGRG